MDPVGPNNAEAVMEKLRLKFAQKPWSETTKLVHLCMDKSHQATSTEASDSPISTCLEKIQRTLNESLSTVMIRLESLSKKKGLNYHVSPSGGVCYITSESFYIEIHLEVDGKVKDVKLAHPGKSPRTCEDLLQLLRMDRYDSFEKTLEELLNIYQIPGSNLTKARVYVALQSLEKDLCLLSTLHKTPGMDRITEMLSGKIGFLTPSSGETPLSLEFYLSQCQILEEQLTPGLQVPGRKVFVTIRTTDTSHKLPLCPLIVEYPPSETGNPSALPPKEVTFATLQACFFLRFPQPFPMSSPSIHELQKLTGIPMDGLKPAPLHELIVQSALSEMQKEDLMASNSRFIVSLPDCPKLSFFIDKGSEKPGLTGAMVTEIPFTHPKHVPDMIEVLRHQATYNTLISSCVSEKTECDDPLELLHFEVSQEKATSFSVTFQHPLKESLTCVMINVLSSREIQCTLYPISEDSLNCNNDYLTRVIKRCTSVPILMRAIFKKATKLEVDVTQSTGGNTEESSSDVQAENTQE